MKSMCNNIQSLKACALTLAVVLSLFGTPSYAQEKSNPATVELPATLIGTWQVTEVHIDTAAAWRRYYQYNDPRLTGRLFTIGHQQLTSTTSEEELCVNPKASIRRTTAAELIKNSMAGRRNTVPGTPTPKDYELPLTDDAPVDVLSVNCEKNGLFGGGLGHTIEGAWIVVLNKDQLAIRWYDETILLLHRFPDNAKPKPSFDCHKAANVTEKTICGSVALAALDQSVAQTYKFAVNVFKEAENPQALAQLKVTQKQWLTQRNTCSTDVRCLEKSMKGRLQDMGVVTDLRGQ